MAVWYELAKAFPRDLVFFFYRLIAVANRAYGYVASLLQADELFFKDCRSINHYIDKVTPRFSVSGKFFHEYGITVLAFVSATNIVVYSVVNTRDTRFVQY